VYEIVGVTTTVAAVGIWPEVHIEAGVIILVSVQGREQAVSIILSPIIHSRFRSMG
jgi:hypothetical protein